MKQTMSANKKKDLLTQIIILFLLFTFFQKNLIYEK